MESGTADTTTIRSGEGRTRGERSSVRRVRGAVGDAARDPRGTP
ncbi:hypothetical protein ACFY30_30220 [Streptomyces sp. NPDC000345]